MAIHEYKIRMTVQPPEATSANVKAWLDEALADDSKRIAADPGPGEERVGLRVDREKIIELANKKGERVPVMLRRLIATHVTIPDAPKKKTLTFGKEFDEAEAAAAELIPDRVLPRKLCYDETDFLPIVETMDSGIAMAYRRIYGLKAIETQKTPSDDRKLAVAMAECVNRRSPEWLLANADLFRLLTSALRWGFAQTEALEKSVEEERAKRKAAGLPEVPLRVEKKPAPAAASAPAPGEPSEQEINDHLFATAQREGQF